MAVRSPRTSYPSDRRWRWRDRTESGDADGVHGQRIDQTLGNSAPGQLHPASTQSVAKVVGSGLERRRAGDRIPAQGTSQVGQAVRRSERRRTSARLTVVVARKVAAGERRDRRIRWTGNGGGVYERPGASAPVARGGKPRRAARQSGAGSGGERRRV